jgi:glycosyltransferase involved in cell wall biosynthesis
VSNGYHPHFYAGPAARLAGVKLLLFCRDFPRERGPRPAVERMAFFLGADAYLGASRAVVQSVARRIGRRRPVLVVPSGVELREFEPDADAAARVRAELGLSAQNLVVTVAGRLQRWKGQSLFLEAAARISSEVPAARFAVAGTALFGQDSDYPEELRGKASALGIAEKVLFLGHRSDMPAVFAASDIVVHSSVAPEPFGRVIIEAMAAGHPVIVARAGGAVELFVEGESGMGYEPGSPDALASAVIALCRDEELRVGLGRAGRQRVESLYTAEGSAAALMDALESITQRAAP